MPGSDEVDVLVVAAGTEVETYCSLGAGAMLSGDRDTEGRCVITQDSRIST